MGFVEYCVANYKLDIDLYGGNKLVAGGADAFLSWLDGIGCASYDAMRKYGYTGTITMEITEEAGQTYYYVHWIDVAKPSGKEAGDAIKGTLEKWLRRVWE